jgi:hypothetical protein
MPAIKTPAFRRFIAEQIIESVSETTSSKLYLSVGRPGEWANDAAPDTPINSVDEKRGIWNNMHFMKRITGNDMALVVRRVNWTSNTAYDAYNHGSDLNSLNYYVLTTDFNVYKCLENNRGGRSTVMPTYSGTSTTNRTSDGYLWKYMYSLTRAQRLRFLTNDWMPVQQLSQDNGSTQYQVQDFALDGGIESIRVTATGNGYNNTVLTNVVITGDGTGARANIVANTISNTVQYIAVVASGSGYTWANVTITSNNSNANGATVEAVISPPGGHGSDAVDELSVCGLMIDIRLRGDENQTVKANNDFRQIAIIRDPTLRSTGNVSTNTVINQVVTLTLSGSSNPFEEDEWAYQGPSLTDATFKGKVIWFGGNELQLTNTSGSLISTSIFGANSAASRFVADYESTPLTPYSGTILYIDHRTPIIRSNVQTENLQIPIIF